jgi:hypothetical protein
MGVENISLTDRGERKLYGDRYSKERTDFSIQKDKYRNR